MTGASRQGVMASNTNKGKEIVAAGKGFKRLRKGIKGSSSSAKGAQGLSWFNTQKEVKYALENWTYEGHLTLEFPTILHKVPELGLGYIFTEPEECNLTLMREFYAN
ncbi:hypothetical protein HAX54_004766 [Datura stramonium]|uniref:Uncharacterized protein n=1 Tax=Datura stramonium TaxID=4076 RepID=A0ABS8WWS6_DATST|nr:hypothetical protein [Datura stramonium]